MATAFNTNVTLYAGVPLVKGGTEVLYLAASAAKGVLGAYQTATYSAYYFERENRRYIQIDDIFGNLDSVNYISFENNSHGGKIYFGFVDQVIYINDHNTQIEFTIDPFPTFYGDTEELDKVYVVRNTYKYTNARTANFIQDFTPASIKKVYTNVQHFQRAVSVTNPVVYFAGPGDYVTIGDSGIKVGKLTDSLLQNIQDHGGVIIGGYADIFNGTINGYFDIITPLADITFSTMPLSAGASIQKLHTGLYNDLLLVTSSGAKQYDIEDFANPETVTFGALICILPSPMVFIYPKEYRGIAQNIGEGISIKVPSVPITANATYTDAQFFSDAKGLITSAIGGAVAGGVKAGYAGAVVGAVSGAIGGAANMGANIYATQFKAPTIVGRGEPMLTPNGNLIADFVNVSPYQPDTITKYLDYYGYQVNTVWEKANVNTDDGAFLQTGGEFLHGSEADAELNARIMSGIKIRKTL